MKNNKGQSLVEFIIILPILLIIVMSIVDFGSIILNKYRLENDIDEVTDLYLEKDYDKIITLTNDHNIKLSTKKNDDYVIFTLSRETSINSPLLKLIIGDDYSSKVSKMVYNE